MRFLQKSELYLVKPRFRVSVLKAWDRGEDVPFSVTILSDENLTKKQVDRIKKLNDVYHWE